MLEKITDLQLRLQVNCFSLLMTSKNQTTCINLLWINIFNYLQPTQLNTKKKIHLQQIHYKKSQIALERNTNMKYIDSVVEDYLKKINYYQDYKQQLIQQKREVPKKKMLLQLKIIIIKIMLKITKKELQLHQKKTQKKLVKKNITSSLEEVKQLIKKVNH